jgi:uncharacterized membrane protein YhfC
MTDNFSMLTPSVIITGITIIVTILAIIFSFGVVWRTEKELDLSYKFFLGAIIFFAVSEFLELFSFAGRIVLENFILGSRLLFAILFLAGMLIARDLLRKMDGEKGIIPDEQE